MHCFLLKNFNPQKDLINFFNNSFILEIFHPDLLFFLLKHSRKSENLKSKLKAIHLLGYNL